MTRACLVIKTVHFSVQQIFRFFPLFVSKTHKCINDTVGYIHPVLNIQGL